MDIRRHASCITDLGAPSDMQDGSCAALPVAVHADEYGVWARSYWQPSAEELGVLQAGGSLELWVRLAGTNTGQIPNLSHPVVSLGVIDEPTEPV